VEAAQCFERAVSLDSRNYRAQLSLATARFFLGRHEDLLVQTTAMNQLFSKEDAPQRLAAISSVLMGISVGATPSFLGKLADGNFPVATILDQSVGAALNDNGGHKLLTDLLTAFRSVKGKPQSLLGRFLTPKVEPAPQQVLDATRHVPSIARAWTEFDAAVKAYWASGHCTPEIMDRIDRAAGSHPEAMFLFTQGTFALELPAEGPAELLAKLIRSEKAFDQASHADAILTQVQVDARVQVVQAQYTLGTDHQTVKADSKMAAKALENIRWLHENGKLSTKYAVPFSGYALKLGDPHLASDVAKWLVTAEPANLEARVQAGTALLAAGDFTQALRYADEVLAKRADHKTAKELRGKIVSSAMEFAGKLSPKTNGQ
jgi:hypothetical protein